MPSGPDGGASGHQGAWWAVTAHCPSAALQGGADVQAAWLDDVSACFYALGAPGLEYEDGMVARADWVDEDLPPGRPFVRAYFPVGPDWESRHRRLTAALACAGGEWAVEPVQETDWAHAWQKFFHAVRPGRRVWVVPAWEAPPDPEGLIVRLDPGMAFGTGTHATTALMIALLEESVEPGQRWLDVGTGSGILALAAWRLGAHVGAVDIDPVAVDAARRNVAAHEAPIAVWQGTVRDVPASEWALDGVAANLTADILLGEWRGLADRVRPGGRLLLSGIIEERWPQVLAPLGAGGLVPTAVRRQDGWVAAALTVP